MRVPQFSEQREQRCLLEVCKMRVRSLIKFHNQCIEYSFWIRARPSTCRYVRLSFDRICLLWYRVCVDLIVVVVVVAVSVQVEGPHSCVTFQWSTICVQHRVIINSHWEGFIVSIADYKYVSPLLSHSDYSYRIIVIHINTFHVITILKIDILSFIFIHIQIL